MPALNHKSPCGASDLTPSALCVRQPERVETLTGPAAVSNTILDGLDRLAQAPADLAGTRTAGPSLATSCGRSMREDEVSQAGKPYSACTVALLDVLSGKHADQMDSFPLKRETAAFPEPTPGLDLRGARIESSVVVGDPALEGGSIFVGRDCKVGLLKGDKDAS